MNPSSRTPHRALATTLLAAGLVLAAVAPAAPPAPPAGEPARQPRLEDFIAEPGTSQRFQTFMLHADLWQDLDQRVKLDTIVFALDNGARACRVLDRDSLWAVDYTWVYPHDRFPPRWYDARDLIRTGDSLRLDDAADIRLTFGTLRTGVRAGSLAQATTEAYRRWPHQMSQALRGRLQLKLDRAKKALAGHQDTGPVEPPPTEK